MLLGSNEYSYCHQANKSNSRQTYLQPLEVGTRDCPSVEADAHVTLMEAVAPSTDAATDAPGYDHQASKIKNR
jgi:hypothetical protein